MSCSSSSVQRSIAMQPGGYFASLGKVEAKVFPIVLDTETTGVFPPPGQEGLDPRVVQLAIYIPQLGLVFDEKIYPEISIPYSASIVHGIYDCDVRCARVFYDAWGDGLQFIESHRSGTGTFVCMGHNVRDYDLKVLSKEFDRFGIEFEGFKSFDTLDLSRILFADYADRRVRGFYTLGSLVAMLGIDEIKAHDASGDVQVNAQLFDKFVDGIDSDKINQALLEEESEKAMAALIKAEGRFNPELEYDFYIKAGRLVVPLARACFPESVPQEFYELKYLAELLDLVVFDRDKETQTRWRVFLELTQGVKRSEIRDAVMSENPLQAVCELLPPTFAETIRVKLESCSIINKITLEFGKRLFGFHGIAIQNWGDLAKQLITPLKAGVVSLGDSKRIFMKLTRGLHQKSVENALRNNDPVSELMDLIVKAQMLHSFLPKSVDRKRGR